MNLYIAVCDEYISFYRKNGDSLIQVQWCTLTPSGALDGVVHTEWNFQQVTKIGNCNDIQLRARTILFSGYNVLFVFGMH